MTTEASLTAKHLDGIPVLTDEGARAGGLLVAFSSRRGGESLPPFDTLNLAITVGDDEAAVDANRKRIGAALGFDAFALARQVHGADLLEVHAGASGVCGEADILATTDRGQVISILTADCAPVVLASDESVAIAHAGWRGAIAGAIERAAEWVGEPRLGYVGPCIRACCYEVGPEVIDAFEKRGLPVADDRHVDPRDAAVHVLASIGVPSIATTDVCTSCDPNYFSYRRDHRTGRQGAFAALIG